MKYAAEIKLRALEPEDLELIYRIENHPDFVRWSAASAPYSRYIIRQYLETTTNNLFSDQQVRLVIEQQNADGEVISIGFADLTNYSPQHQRAEISLAILPEYQGNHAAEPAVRLLEEYARRLRLHQLYAIIAHTNAPALRLFQRLGYEETARLPQWIYDGNSYVEAHVFSQLL